MENAVRGNAVRGCFFPTKCQTVFNDCYSRGLYLQISIHIYIQPVRSLVVVIPTLISINLCMLVRYEPSNLIC